MDKVSPGRDLGNQAFDYAEASDATLMAQVSLRDQLALAEVFRRNASLLVATATKVTKSRTLAEEIVQEVMVKLWNESDKFEPTRGTLRSFLLVQVHRRGIDAVRSESARSRREEKVEVMDRKTDLGFAERVVEQVEMESLMLSLANLSVGERLAIELAYFHGYTYHEVAAILHEADGTVKSRIRTGLRKLRETLEKSRLGEQDGTY